MRTMHHEVKMINWYIIIRRYFVIFIHPLLNLYNTNTSICFAAIMVSNDKYMN